VNVTSDPPGFWLYADGALLGKLVLDGEQLVLGRSPACDITLADSAVSGDHLLLSRHGGAVLATDLGSSNGTLLNGRPLDRPARLRNGDTLVLGGVRLQAVLPQIAGSDTTLPAATTAAKLTDQEREVAIVLVGPFRVPGVLAPRPATRAEIADAVSLSERTVQRRLDSLCVKLALPTHAPRDRPHLLAQQILERGIDAQR
jgi:predicted component of type VI protein secretion system